MRSNTTDNDGEYEQVLVMAQVIDPAERKGGMRLSMPMKQEVIDKAMKHGFGKREEALNTEEVQLSKLFYLHAFGATVLNHVKALKDTPFVLVGVDGYGRKATGFSARTRWNVGGQTLDLAVDATLPLRADHGGRGPNPFTIKDGKLIERCREWQAARDKYAAEHEQTRMTLKGMLERITTYPSLEKNWPQGKKFYQHLPKAYPFRHQVPAVLINELNATLGLA